MSKLSWAVVILLALCFGAPQRSLAGQVQCYGTVQSVVVDGTGNISVTLVPTPPATQQPCAAPCNPDPGTGWTFLTLAAAAPSRDLVYAGALVALVSSKPVYVAADTTFFPGGSNCQIVVFQVKMS
jgi:hypothetical protein